MLEHLPNLGALRESLSLCHHGAAPEIDQRLDGLHEILDLPVVGVIERDDVVPPPPSEEPLDAGIEQVLHGLTLLS